jgi:hypothetical protein
MPVGRTIVCTEPGVIVADAALPARKAEARSAAMQTTSRFMLLILVCDASSVQGWVRSSGPKREARG